MERREVFERVKRATVAVAAMNREGATHPFTIIGSGFCVDPRGLIVTCRHVLEAMMEKTAAQQISEVSEEESRKNIQKLPPVQAITPFAVFYAGQSKDPEQLLFFPCQVDNATAKTDFDLAMLRVLPHKAFASGYPFLEIEESGSLAEGDLIGTCGFPLGNYLYDQLGTVTSSFTTGIISSVIPAAGVTRELLRGFQLDLTATHGNSGGPVFSISSGRVFGVLQLGVADRKGAPLHGLTKAEPVYPIVHSDVIEAMKKPPPGRPVLDL
jgi:S1-C subfamily serine protease